MIGEGLVGKGNSYDRNYGLWIDPQVNRVLFQPFLMGARSPRNQYSSVSPYTLLLLILIGTILPEHMMVRT